LVVSNSLFYFCEVLSIISYSDFIELREKIHSSKLSFFLGKFSLRAFKRVQSHWNAGALPPTNWWNIPLVRKRWNKMITGNDNQSYINYVIEKYLHNCTNLNMLSIGCGTGSQELDFLKSNVFTSITAIDLAFQNIQYAQSRTNDERIQFIHSSFEQFESQQTFDIILFHSSLHHLKNLEQVIAKIKTMLSNKGIIIIHEYTGPDRIQWNHKQLDVVNSILNTIPQNKRTYLSGKIKKRQTAPGLLRMLIADPSEAVESSKILPLLNAHFQMLELNGYGGNILVPLLKGISQHFIEESEENFNLLNHFFNVEDSYLVSQTDDFHFGVYKKTAVTLLYNGC